MNKELYELIGVAVQGFITIVIAYIAFKQATMGKVMKDLELNTNSMKDQLVAITKTSSMAEGNLQGRAEQTAERNAATVSSTKTKNEIEESASQAAVAAAAAVESAAGAVVAAVTTKK